MRRYPTRDEIIEQEDDRRWLKEVTKETQPMSDTLPEREDQMDQHQSATCTIPECPCREWSSQIAAAENSRQRREAIKLSQAVARAESAAKEVTDQTATTATHQPAARGGGDGPVFERVGSEILIHARNQVYRFHWQDADLAAALYHHLRSSQTPAESADLNLPWYWMEGTNRILADANSQGQKFVICDMLDEGPKGMARARYTVQAVNQHQSLVAERELLRQAIEVAIHNLNAGNDPKFLADYLRLTLDLE